jgi:hypothetical protein
MHLIDLSENLWFELGEPTDTSVVKILKYLIFHIGDLNDLIAENYVISGNDSSPELSDDTAAIYAALYMDYYYQKQSRDNLGAAGIQVLEVREADSVVRVASRTEVSKTFLQLKNQNKDYLNKLVDSYRRWKCVPASLHSNFYNCVTYQKTLQQP